MQSPHPFRVTSGEIVIDGHDVNAVAGKRVQVDRQGGDEGLSFTSLHFRNPAKVQCHPAHDLNVEVAA